MHRFLFVFLALLAAGSLEAQTLNTARPRPVRRYLWRLPECSTTTGHPAVILSRDAGASLVTRQQALTGIGYTFGLVRLDTPNTLLAVHNETVLKSTDAGCSWNVLGLLPAGTFPPYLMAAPEGRAYGWSPNRDTLFSIAGDRITTLVSPAGDIGGLGVDSADALHVRVVGAGAIHESRDGGATWSRRASLPANILLYEVEFDPNNLDHALAGTASDGAFVTFDGGTTWTRSSGFSKIEKPSVNVFNLVVSPVDSSVVWAMALDLAEGQSASGGRHIYRSTDGGLSFTPVVDSSADVRLTNGPVMAAHPTNRDVLLFFFGTYFQQYGTDIFTYDAAQQRLRTFHHPIDGINSVAFNPVDPDTVYFGGEVVQGTR
jgi:hypothetical protein